MKNGSEMTSSSSKPFRMPKNISEFARQDDKEIRQERRKQRTLVVHEKGLKPRESERKILARYINEIEEEEQKELQEKGITTDDADEGGRSTAQDKYECGLFHIGTNSEFVEMEREIRQLEYINAEGREEIQNLKKQISLRNKEIAIAEYRVSDEAFDDYVNEEMRKTLLALKMAEEDDDTVLETKEEIQRFSIDVEKVKKEIAVYEELLKHNKMCKDFLWKLSPPAWQKQQEARKLIAKKIKIKKETESATQPNLGQNSGFSTMFPPVQKNSDSNVTSKERSKLNKKKMRQEDEGIVGSLEVYEKPQIYFTDPKQLLNIMAEMEEDTNDLFEELDSMERSKEFYSQNAKKVERDMENDTTNVTEEVDRLTKGIKKNKDTVAELQEKIKLFNESEDGVPKKNSVLQQLHHKLEDVYSACIGCTLDSPTSFQILGDLEIFLYDLLERFENTSQEILKPIMKMYRREKIARMKKEEHRLKEVEKEEVRLRRAAVMQKRAFSDVKKPLGKKVMWRSWLEKKGKVPREDQEKAAISAQEKELEQFLLEYE